MSANSITMSKLCEQRRQK